MLAIATVYVHIATVLMGLCLVLNGLHAIQCYCTCTKGLPPAVRHASASTDTAVPFISEAISLHAYNTWPGCVSIINANCQGHLFRYTLINNS